jgi:isopenicillin N synthase-like dioxygenase
MPAASHVPTVDLRSPDAADRIGAACEHVGFFQIVGHGVERVLVGDAWRHAGDFFDLPRADRMAVAMPEPGYPYGYQAMEVERLASSLGTATPPDRKHTWSCGPIDPPDHVPTDPDEIWIRSPNRWPGALPGFRPAMESYYREMAILCARIMSLMAEALALPSDYFDRFISAHTSALRLIDYPHPETAPLQGQLRAGAHTDYGTLTLLLQEQAPGGLEVLALDGAWVPVPSVDGAFVVNVGDCLARWTNDRWRSTLHRVVNPPADAEGSTRRRSIAFFHNANWDAIIECLPTCLLLGEAPRYEPVLAGRHLMSKFVSTVT